MPSKYKNVKTEVDNVVFASKKEASRYVDLRALLKSGIISNLELQKKYVLTVNGVRICAYVADFSYLDSNNREVVEDVKSDGTRTAVYRLKSKLMLACYGIRIVET